LGTIDRGLYGGKNLKEFWPLPPECEVNSNEPDDARRLLAVSIKVLEEAASGGHTLLAGDQLSERVLELPLSPPAPMDPESLEILEEDFAPEVKLSRVDDLYFAQLDRYVEAGDIIRGAVAVRLKDETVVEAQTWRAKLDQALEARRSAADIASMNSDPLEQEARQEKAEALRQLAASKIAVLIGPAGSGKTTLLKILLNEESLVGSDIALLAPTGKARVRLGSQTGMPERARTLAQFLLQEQKWDPQTGAYTFSKTGPTAQVSTCVVDEASMLTEDQLAALVSSLPAASRLILVGDPQQLPPIGAGRPFVDLIAHLEREAGGSGIGKLSISRRQIGSASDGAGDELEDIQLAKVFSGDRAAPGEDEIAGRSVSGLTSDRLKFLEWDTAESLRTRIRRSTRWQTQFGARADFEGSWSARANDQVVTISMSLL
jgi:GTPase SAR1 family protein